MSLTLMYITNDPEIALIAEQNDVERIWVDLETIGKDVRQKGYDSVKSKHSIADVERISKVLTKSNLLVRVNPWYENSYKEIEEVISAGAHLIMLPMWKTASEVSSFLGAVNKRVKTILLLETKEAVDCLDEVLALKGIDEIHIGLNDLHLSYGMSFMFEPLANGMVESICYKIKNIRIPYGFGGIARIGEGMLPAEKILLEHYRLGSTRVILSRTFCDPNTIQDRKMIQEIFEQNIIRLRQFEDFAKNQDTEFLLNNKAEVKKIVGQIVQNIKGLVDL